jgi:hypothetical protein
MPRGDPQVKVEHVGGHHLVVLKLPVLLPAGAGRGQDQPGGPPVGFGSTDTLHWAADCAYYTTGLLDNVPPACASAAVYLMYATREL